MSGLHFGMTVIQLARTRYQQGQIECRLQMAVTDLGCHSYEVHHRKKERPVGVPAARGMGYLEGLCRTGYAASAGEPAQMPVR